jgi:glucose-1-phosphate adenylyltransferase
MEVNGDYSVRAFHEKKADAPGMPDEPDMFFASMGNYIFSTGLLLRELYADAAREDSAHDFGRDILPRLVDRGDMYAYDFRSNNIPGDPEGSVAYWRDVGTLDAYYDASMDLRSVTPQLNLYNRQWPLRSAAYDDPPPKFTFDDENRRGHAIDSIVAGGSILSGGFVRNSVIGRGVKIHSGSVIEDCIVFDNCDIGRNSKIKRAILDKNVRLPEGTVIGYDPVRDRQLYNVTESGLVVVEGRRSRVEIASMQI